MHSARKHLAVRVVAFSLMLFASAPAFATWFALNTCWNDFDVNGGKFFGVTSPLCGGITQGLYSKTSFTIDRGSPYSPQPPDSSDRIVGVTVTNSGKPLVLKASGAIFVRAGTGWYALPPNPQPTCTLGQIAVAGDILFSTGRFSGAVLVKEDPVNCTSPRAFHFSTSTGAWTQVATNVLDISMTKGGAGNMLGILKSDFLWWTDNSGELPLWRSYYYVNFNVCVPGTTLCGAWNSNLLGGGNLVRQSGGQCTFIDPDGYGAWLKDMWTGTFVGPGSEGGSSCKWAQLNPDPSTVTKVVEGGRMPSSGDIFWIRTTDTRVYAWAN